MSVFKSQRNDAVAEFLKATSSVHLESMRSLVTKVSAHARRCNFYETLEGMDLFFMELFHDDELEARELRFPCTLLPIRTEMGWKYRQRDLPAERKSAVIWNQ